MKKAYIFLLCCSAFGFTSTAQSPTDNCSEAYSHMVYVISHMETALKPNTLQHVVFYGEKAKIALKKAEAALENCDCDGVEDKVGVGLNYLTDIETSKEYDEALFNANKAKEWSQKAVQDMDLCIEGLAPTTEAVVVEDTTTVSTADELSDIEKAQQQLAEQQKELQRQQEALQQKLAAKKAQELQLKKEALIKKLEHTVSTNVSTFNEALKACDCDGKTLKANLKKETLKHKSISEIKGSVIKVIKSLTENYKKQLADCDEETDDD